MILQQLIDIIESAAPLKWQEAWDNSGLQVGDRNANVHKALLTTDVTEAVVDEAIALDCDVIVSHHPLLYRGLKQVCGQTPQARIVEKAVLHHIAIYSSHTALDNYLHGISGQMAERIGLTDYRILVDGPACQHVGEYGLGVIGQLPQPMAFTQLLAHIKSVFDAPMLRYIEPVKPMVQTMALCGGAGSEFMPQAIAQHADVYLTADCKYHEMAEAQGQIGVIDMDHWVSEHFSREQFAQLLEGHIQTIISQQDHSPINIY